MDAERRKKIGLVIRIASGNFLEMYDFMVFGYYAKAIAQTFFPVGSALMSLMLALMTFAAGFLMRPLGAVILGAYIDRHGRRKGLLLTLGLMSIGTFLLAVTPGYTTLGYAAPLLVLGARLLQGFSAGVELGGVSVYLAEIATPGHRGFYVAWQSASQQVAVVFAASVGVALHASLTPAAMDDWGWRLPLGIGCLIIPFLFAIRRSLPETDPFLAASHRPTLSETAAMIRSQARTIAGGVLLVTMTTVSFYMITAYTPTFASTVLQLTQGDNLLVTVCVGLSNLLWLPVFGALSDRIGRTPILLTATALMLLTVYPALLWLTAAPSFAKLLVVELWLSLLYASYNGAMVVYLTEVMPARIRTSGFALAYSLATALFGGFTPAVCTYLIHATGDHAAAALWLMLAAACGLAGTLGFRRRELSKP